MTVIGKAHAGVAIAGIVGAAPIYAGAWLVARILTPSSLFHKYVEPAFYQVRVCRRHSSFDDSYSSQGLFIRSINK